MHLVNKHYLGKSAAQTLCWVLKGKAQSELAQPCPPSLQRKTFVSNMADIRWMGSRVLYHEKKRGLGRASPDGTPMLGENLPEAAVWK